MSTIEIEYCVPCGHLDRAIEVQRELLETFGRAVDSVALDTGDSGVFKVRVDDELVFDKSEEAFDLETIVDRVDARIVAAQ